MYKPVASFMALLLMVLPCTAQQPTTQLLIPAGTRMSVVLTQQISSSDTHVGDQIHAQLVSPVVTGSQVAIPAGTYLQGSVARITQQKDRVELTLRSASLAYGNGYVANVEGPIAIRSGEGWLLPSPKSHRGLALIPFLLAPGIGAAIGAASGKDAVLTPGSIAPNGQLTPGSVTPDTRGRNAAIGFGVGAGIAAIGVAIYVAAGHHGKPDFFFAAGAPMDSVLNSAVSLDAAQAEAATAAQPPSIQPVAQRPQPAALDASTPTTPSGICFAPDTPGTPPTIIPGTPAIGDSPGTPDIVIPGTPSIPGGVIPCS